MTATIATAAKKGITRMRDKLFLFTGHNSLKQEAGERVPNNRGLSN